MIWKTYVKITYKYLKKIILEGRSVITVINMIKNIIFDVYGTLISTGTGSVDATRIIFEKYNLEDSPVEIYRKWKEIHKKHINKLDEYQSEKEIFIKDLEELFFLYGIKDNPRVRIKPMLDSLYKRQLFEDTESVIKDLSRNYNIAIGSITDTEPLMHNIRDTYLFTIRNIFTSEYLKCYKPNKKFYSQILQLTNWKPEECVFVGDSMDDDVIGPLKVGMKPILIDRKDRYSEYHDGVKKIKTLLELKQAINE